MCMCTRARGTLYTCAYRYQMLKSSNHNTESPVVKNGNGSQSTDSHQQICTKGKQCRAYIIYILQCVIVAPGCPVLLQKTMYKQMLFPLLRVLCYNVSWLFVTGYCYMYIVPMYSIIYPLALYQTSHIYSAKLTKYPTIINSV